MPLPQALQVETDDRFMKTAELDYTLPETLIAQEPIEPRDESRLLVLNRTTNQIDHRRFREIGDFLVAGDCLVVNESRVIRARMYGHKEPTGGQVEILLLRQLEEEHWRCLVGGARTRPGSLIRFHSDGTPVELYAEVIESGAQGQRVLRFSEPLLPLLDQLGEMPLPPYIHRHLEDPERYQTVYARAPGSAAAPTAGLHFTPDLLLDLRAAGIKLVSVTLHVGLDTFRPITEATVDEHVIHSEWCSLDTTTAERINHTKLMGRRVVAVGTTSVRVLETAARHGLLKSTEETCPWRPIAPYEGFTDLYITPGFDFRVVDSLVTNFHLPRSSLLALVMAFAGKERIRHAYQTAIAQQYRFYSFGDAMLIL